MSRVGQVKTVTTAGLVLLLVFGSPCHATLAAQAVQGQSLLGWEELPPLPDPIGFGGPFSGTTGGALLVAGGANFPDKPPWEDGEKVWYDTIFVLEEPDGQWKTVLEKLPRPLAYGISVTTKDGVICMGGGDADRFHADVFMLTWTGNRIETTQLPPLPRPCAFSCGALLDTTIYVAGGLEKSDATKSLHHFWALDLSRPSGRRRWRELQPWPGPERHLAVAAVQDGSFFLFSGFRLEADSRGKRKRVEPYLSDAYRYLPGKGVAEGKWKQIADLPCPVAAAPTPALPLGQSHILILGGIDEPTSNADPAMHPGFTSRILAYHTLTDTWIRQGHMPAGASRVTVPTTWWRGGCVIPSGERSAGRRSPKIYRAKATRELKPFGLVNWIVLCAYLAVLVGIGFYMSKREKSTNDFFLAGRRVPWWAAALSIYGTQLSAITFMSIPAVVYSTNCVRILASLMMIAVAPVVVFCYLPFYCRLNVTTAYEYLEKRFNLSVRLYGSATFMLFQVGRMGIVMYLPAIALSTVTGMNIYVCIAVMGVFCTAYTVLGGIEAVIWTDVLQVFVLLGGAACCLFVIASQVGGIGNIVSIGLADGKFAVFNWAWNPSEMVVWVMLLGGFFLFLIPYTSDQTVVQRYLTTRDERQAARGIWTNVALIIPGMCLFSGTGVALYAYYKTHPGMLTASMNDEIFPIFIVQQLPVGVTGLVIAGVFAAAMSSLDSSMNSMAAAYVNDFHRRFRPNIADHVYLKLARWLVVLIGVVGTGTAMLLASIEIRSLVDHFNMIMGMFGGCLAGVFALAVFTRRANGNGALIGALAGTLLLLIVKYATDVNFYLYAPIGVGSCVLVGYVASLLLPGDGRKLDGLTVYTMNALRMADATTGIPSNDRENL